MVIMSWIMCGIVVRHPLCCYFLTDWLQADGPLLKSLPSRVLPKWIVDIICFQTTPERSWFDSNACKFLDPTPSERTWGAASIILRPWNRISQHGFHDPFQWLFQGNGTVTRGLVTYAPMAGLCISWCRHLSTRRMVNSVCGPQKMGRAEGLAERGPHGIWWWPFCFGGTRRGTHAKLSLKSKAAPGCSLSQLVALDDSLLREHFPGRP